MKRTMLLLATFAATFALGAYDPGDVFTVQAGATVTVTDDDRWTSTVDWGTVELDQECKVTGDASARIESGKEPHRQRNVQGDFSTTLHLRKGRKYRLVTGCTCALSSLRRSTLPMP